MINITVDISGAVNIVASTREIGVNFIRQLGFDLWGRLVLHSPVDTGRYKTNWGVSFRRDSGATNNPELINSYPRAYPDMLFTNNLPYAEVIENGWFTTKPETAKTIGGFSKKAPRGVAGPSVEEINSWLGSM